MLPSLLGYVRSFEVGSRLKEGGMTHEWETNKGRAWVEQNEMAWLEWRGRYKRQLCHLWNRCQRTILVLLREQTMCGITMPESSKNTH
jgi:hypothetical protein